MKAWRRATVAVLLCALWIASALDDRSQQPREWYDSAKPVILYYGAPDALGIAPEVRWIPSGEITARRLVEELTRGPRDKRLAPVLTPTAKILGVEQNGERVTVNFDRSVVREHPGGSAGEIATVYAVVNTLTELPGVSEVMWLIEGQVVESLVGHMDLSSPLVRSDEVIVRL